jgi:hypothetical protein
MRGVDAMQEGPFTVAKLDDFVPADHPLRSIRVLVNDALAAMNTRFNEIYADTGPGLDCAGEADSRSAAASVLLDPQRAAAVRAVALKPAVSLVRRPRA